MNGKASSILGLIGLVIIKASVVGFDFNLKSFIPVGMPYQISCH